jgi:PAS fold/Two component regulator propeller
VWAGTLNGGVSKFKDGHFTTYTTTNGLASNTISSILETREGAMWFATPSEYTGLSVEQSSGTSRQRAVHPEDLAQHSENWRTSVANRQLFEGEARFRRAAVGDYRWFLVRWSPTSGPAWKYC